MLLYYPSWTLLGFIIHFYITFWTNLLTQSPVLVPVFPLFQCFEEKEYQTESKRNETFGKVIFGNKAIRETSSARQGINEKGTRQGGALHPRGPLVAPLTYFFLLYIPIHPKTFGEEEIRSSTAGSLGSHQNPIRTLFGYPAGGGNPHRWPSSSSRRSP